MEVLLCQAKVQGRVQRAASFRDSVQVWIGLSLFSLGKYKMNKDPELKKGLLTRPEKGGHANKTPHHSHEKRSLQSQACRPIRPTAPNCLQFGQAAAFLPRALLPVCRGICNAPFAGSSTDNQQPTRTAELPESPGGAALPLIVSNRNLSRKDLQGSCPLFLFCA